MKSRNNLLYESQWGYRLIGEEVAAAFVISLGGMGVDFGHLEESQ
jgi:hypothetical protein